MISPPTTEIRQRSASNSTTIGLQSDNRYSKYGLQSDNRYSKRVGTWALIYLTAVLEYLVAEIDGRRAFTHADPGLWNDYPFDLAFATAELANRCVAREPSSRPTMIEVFRSLSAIYSSTMDWDLSDITNSSSMSHGGKENSIGGSVKGILFSRSSGNVIRSYPVSVQELLIIDDMLSVLESIEGRYILMKRARGNDGQYVFQDLTQRIFPPCEDYVLISQFVESKSFFKNGLVNHAFAVALRALLLVKHNSKKWKPQVMSCLEGVDDLKVDDRDGSSNTELQEACKELMGTH